MTTEQPRLTIVPATFRQACAFVARHHRHHQPPNGRRFSLGVEDEHGELRGVAIVSHPVARHLMDGYTVEVIRTATDGCPNANSALYGAAWRAARALGYRRLITYTMAGESGASLRGAGMHVVGELAPRPGWSTPSRPRDDTHPTGVARTLWDVVADGDTPRPVETVANL